MEVAGLLARELIKYYIYYQTQLRRRSATKGTDETYQEENNRMGKLQNEVKWECYSDANPVDAIYELVRL
jgi:hypothetical protein